MIKMSDTPTKTPTLTKRCCKNGWFSPTLKKGVGERSETGGFTRRMALTSIVGVIVCLFTPFTHASPSQTLSDLLSHFTTMRADFTQTVFATNGHVIQKNSGEMALSRPNKFRWEIKKPNPQLLIADGNYLWVYDVELAQATRQKIDPQNTNSPASLLSGSIKNLEDRFTVALLPKTPGTWFRLKPKNPDDSFKEITLNFNNQKLSQMHLLDTLGTRSTFTFIYVTMDPELPSDLFQFKVPKNVELIKN